MVVTKLSRKIMAHTVWATIQPFCTADCCDMKCCDSCQISHYFEVPYIIVATHKQQSPLPGRKSLEGCYFEDFMIRNGSLRYFNGSLRDLYNFSVISNSFIGLEFVIKGRAYVISIRGPCCSGVCPETVGVSNIIEFLNG